MFLSIKKPLFLILLCQSIHSFAGVMGTDAPLFYDGFYAGATLGLSNYLNKEQHAVNAETHQIGSLGPLGGGFVGYDYILNEYFNIALEGFGNASGLNAAINHNDLGTTYSTHSQYNAGIRVLPGYQFAPGMQGHIILGYSNAHFRVEDSGNYGYIDASFNKSGFQSGLGWSKAIFQGCDLRLDMMYTIYGKQNNVGNGLPNSGAPLQYYSNGFSTLEGDLSLIYKF
ncbi:MAG TPA: hypothetical protein VHD33_02010 [Legionellaceae bacterium]|nr:hypothetical protein [Legionellaceae bacterium]